MKEYIPTTLRNPPKPEIDEAWGIGIEDNRNDYGMTHGPFSTEIQALECIGEENARLIHFFKDGSYEIVWTWKEDRWIQYG